MFASTAQSYDTKDLCTVLGAALASCALFVKERADKGEVYLMTAAWVDRFITGANQYSSDTYGLMSLEITELLLSVVNAHCE